MILHFLVYVWVVIEAALDQMGNFNVDTVLDVTQVISG